MEHSKCYKRIPCSSTFVLGHFEFASCNLWFSLFSSAFYVNFKVIWLKAGFFCLLRPMLTPDLDKMETQAVGSKWVHDYFIMTMKIKAHHHIQALNSCWILNLVINQIVVGSTSSPGWPLIWHVIIPRLMAQLWNLGNLSIHARSSVHIKVTQTGSSTQREVT